MKFITMLCPFHFEKTPSFSYNKKNGDFHCFGCGITGNLFKLHNELDPEIQEYIYGFIHPEWHGMGNPYHVVKSFLESDPYLCDECYIPALLDRGKRIQCQNCGCETENCHDTPEDWSRYKEKVFSKTIRPFHPTT